MIEVKRYNNGYDDSWCRDGLVGCKRDENGRLVKYEDYLELAVQLANAESKCRELAAENVTLNDKMNKIATWPGIEFYSSAWVFNNCDGDTALEFMCDIQTPATDANLAEVLAQARKEGAHFVANRMLAAWEAGFIEDTAKNAADIARMILTSTEFMPNAPQGDFDRSFADGVLEDIAAQLRKGAAL